MFEGGGRQKETEGQRESGEISVRERWSVRAMETERERDIQRERVCV